MFNVSEKPTFTRTVPVMVPVDGGHREDSLKATFRVLPTEQAAEFNLDSNNGSTEFLRAVIVSLDDVVGADKKPLPYSDGLRDQLLTLPYVRIGLARSYIEAVGKAKAGN